MHAFICATLLDLHRCHLLPGWTRIEGPKWPHSPLLRGVLGKGKEGTGGSEKSRMAKSTLPSELSSRAEPSRRFCKDHPSKSGTPLSSLHDMARTWNVNPSDPHGPVLGVPQGSECCHFLQEPSHVGECTYLAGRSAQIWNNLRILIVGAGICRFVTAGP